MRANARMWLTGYLDMITAVAAVVVIAAPHWPWYAATLTPPSDEVIAPSGTVTGISAHLSLWAVTALAAVMLALLLARQFPGGPVRLPGSRLWLVLASVSACLIAAWDADLLPDSWFQILSVSGPASGIMWPAARTIGLDGTTLSLTWGYGATAGVWAAAAMLIASVASPGPSARAAGKNPGHHLSPAGDSLPEAAAG